MGNKPLTAIDRSPSLLDRISPSKNQPLSEAQAGVDQLVSVSIQEGTNLKTAAAMLGAGWVGRFTRIGAMASLPGQALARGASYVPALAAESAAFAGIERGFHPSSLSFQRDWAKAAVTLTALKVFGGMSQGQNIILQHLLTDLGLVGGHQVGSAIGLMDKPQESFARQMLFAEATNWQMKGSLAFAHSFSPGLSATERSLDLFLKGQETNLFSRGQSWPFFSKLAPEGGPESLTTSIESEGSKGPDILQMSGNENNGGLGKKNGEQSKMEASPGSGGPLSFETLAAATKTDRSAVEALRSRIIQQNDLRAVHALVEAAKTNPVDAIWALQDLNPNGNEAEQAAFEVQKTIEVGPLVEAIKTNTQGVYWLRNLMNAGNPAAKRAIETFDVTEMAEKAKTDRDTHCALEVFAVSGNKMAQGLLGPPSDEPYVTTSKMLHWGDMILNLSALTRTSLSSAGRMTNDPPDRSEQPDSIRRRFLLITTLLASDPRPPLTVLEEILSSDEDPVARMTAAETLGAWGDPAAVATLEWALSDSRQEVREAADWALKKLSLAKGPGRSSPQDVPGIKILSTRPPRVRLTWPTEGEVHVYRPDQRPPPVEPIIFVSDGVDPSEGALGRSIEGLSGEDAAALGRLEDLFDRRRAPLEPQAGSTNTEGLKKDDLTALQRVEDLFARRTSLSPVTEFPGGEISEITSERDLLLTTHSPKEIDLGAKHDPRGLLPEIQFNALREMIREGQTKVFLLKWTGTKIPRGAKVLGHEIAWTQNGCVHASGGEIIGTYDRTMEWGGKNRQEHQMLIYISPPKLIVEK